jgi:hypothetical protein
VSVKNNMGGKTRKAERLSLFIGTYLANKDLGDELLSDLSVKEAKEAALMMRKIAESGAVVAAEDCELIVNYTEEKIYKHRKKLGCIAILPLMAVLSTYSGDCPVLSTISSLIIITSV